jgi:hypothetical protein
MVYTFACPVPCKRVIKVYASTDDDAIRKIIAAGAISCRNISRLSCGEQRRTRMPLLPKNQLQEIVRLSMELE